VKKRLLLDTNIVLDVLMDRHPHATASLAVFAAVENGKAEGLIAAHAITTLHYLLSREAGEAGAKQALRTLLRLFGVAAVDSDIIQQALQASGQDFEDSVTTAAARASGCHLIVTRDPKGFRRSPIPALNPALTLALLR
jgi:predicted nucleic acid-binding protein